jgi:hypothetical protein
LLEQCRSHAVALERRLAASLTARDEVTVRRWLSGIAAEFQQES